MQSNSQNEQIEILASLARHKGGYNWRDTPISESSDGALDASFYVSHPQQKFRQAALREAQRRDSWHAEAFRDPTTVSGAPPAREMWKGNGPDNATRVSRAEALSRELPMEADELLDVLTQVHTGKKPKSKDATLNWKAKRDAEVAGRSQVAGDRRASDRKIAFDLLMPLRDEMLGCWHGRLHKYVDARGPSAPWFGALGGFLQKVRGRRTFAQLDAQEKDLLKSIVGKIIEAEGGQV